MDISLQITPTGLTYALKPLADTGSEIVGMYMRWPAYGSSYSRLTTTGQQSLLTQKMITNMLLNSAAEAVLLAVENGTAQHRVDATRAALAKQNCTVFDRAPHLDGATGLMRDWLGRKTDDDAHRQGMELPHRKAD